MMEYLNWAVQLEGVSPVARLLAIWMADYARPLRNSPVVPDGEPAHEIDLDAALQWIGCEETEIVVAAEELSGQGVAPIAIEGRKVRFTLPALPEFTPQHAVAMERVLSIYVISAAERVTKIGISKSPKTRLAGLQATNPTNVLKLVWSTKGTSTIIRRAERQAHETLAGYSIGNEWFSVSTETAIEVVQATLERLGFKA